MWNFWTPERFLGEYQKGMSAFAIMQSLVPTYSGKPYLQLLMVVGTQIQTTERGTFTNAILMGGDMEPVTSDAFVGFMVWEN